MKNCSTAFFLMFVDVPAEEICKIKSEVKGIIKTEECEAELSKHIEFTDLKAIVDHFKLND